MNEKVVHPTYYNQHPSGVECIEIARHFPFNRGNAITYIWRAGLKTPEEEITDLEKAIFHLQDEIERLKNPPGRKARVMLPQAKAPVPHPPRSPSGNYYKGADKVDEDLDDEDKFDLSEDDAGESTNKKKPR